MSKETLRSASKEVASYQAGNDVGNIREDLKALKEDASSLVQHAKESGRAQIEVAEERAKKALKQAKVASKDYLEDAETYVRQNPGQSIALAFVGGIIASMLLRR